MLRHAFSYLIAHGLPALLGFAAIIIFTHMLSPEDYGFYVVGMSLAGIVSAVLFAWIRLSILRYQSEGEGADIRLTALVGYGLSVALSPIVLIGLLLTTGSPLDQLLLATMVAVALGLFEFGQNVLNARQLSGAYMRAAILRAVLTLAISLALVHLGMGGTGLLVGIGSAYLATALFSSPGIWRAPVRGFESDVFLRMLAFGAPMAISGMVFSLHAALDRLIVVYFLGEGAAGVYGASADLVRQIILFPAMAVGAAMAPMVIRSLAEGGAERADRQLKLSAEMLLAVVLPATIGLALVAPSFSALMLGPEFRDVAAYLIPVLSFAWLFQAMTQQYVHISFHLAKTSRFLLMQGTALLCINLVLTVILVPAYGLSGAAWALAIAEAMGVVVGFLLARRAHPLPVPTGRIARVLAASAAMAAPTYLVMRLVDDPVLSLALSVATGVASYALAAVALDVVGARGLLLERLRPSVGQARGAT